MRKSLFILCALATVQVCGADESPKTIAPLREFVAFGFPQKEAKMFCDWPTLQFSVWNNDEYWFAQASSVDGRRHLDGQTNQTLTAAR